MARQTNPKGPNQWATYLRKHRLKHMATPRKYVGKWAITQAQYAAMIGVNPATYISWELGNSHPKPNTINAVKQKIEALDNGKAS